jgi:hypothetical protein
VPLGPQIFFDLTPAKWQNQELEEQTRRDKANNIAVTRVSPNPMTYPSTLEDTHPRDSAMLLQATRETIRLANIDRSLSLLAVESVDSSLERNLCTLATLQRKPVLVVLLVPARIQAGSGFKRGYDMA